MTKPKQGPESVRSGVAASYARAVQRGTGCCGSVPVQIGVVARLGGYSVKQLRAVPAAAAENSFGCGNPVAFSEILRGQTVLDLGSGAGIDLFLAARKVGRSGRVIGIDMTDEMIARARKSIAAGGYRNVEVRQGLIEELPVADGSVDWVLSNCVINLSPEKRRVFGEIARVLKPGGQMLVSDIVAQSLPRRVREDARLFASCVSGAISEERYLAGLRAAGLVGVTVRDRLVYDTVQLEAFFSSEMPDEGCCGGGCGCGADAEDLKPLAKRMTGKIWSARVYARKPRRRSR